MPAFIVLKKATINKQDIKTNSPNKTFLEECKSFMELEIINNKPITKFNAAITSSNPLTKSNFSAERDDAIVFTEKINILIGSTPDN